MIGTAVLVGAPLVLVGVSVALTALVPLTLATALGVWLSDNTGIGDWTLNMLQSLGDAR